MADISDVIAYYKARLDTLAPDIGATFAHGIYVQDWGRVRQKLQTNTPGSPAGGHARWWTVSRASTDDRGKAEIVERSAPVHEIVIEGYDGADDEGDTEIAFQILVDRVRDALDFGLDNNPRPKVADGYFQVGPARLITFLTGTLAAAGGSTVHHARLGVRVEERRTAPGGPAWCRR